MNNVSRDDPCPCGSGKKYKFCHGTSNIIPFPGRLKDLNGFIAQQIETATRTPRNEFLGISPQQMEQLLQASPDGLPGVVDVHFRTMAKVAESAPLHKMAVWLLQWLKSGDLKLTASGYLPPLVAKLWWEETLMRLDFWGEDFEVTVSVEADSPLLIDVRNLLAEVGFTEIRSGFLSLTSKGTEFVAASDQDQYRWLYSALSRTMNWNTLAKSHLAEIHPLVQESWFFSLFLLNGIGPEGIEPQKAAELWLNAFPQVVKDYLPPGQVRTKVLRTKLATMIAFYSFELMPRLLGLIDWVPPTKRLESKRVRLSKLGRELHCWKI